MVLFARRAGSTSLCCNVAAVVRQEHCYVKPVANVCSVCSPPYHRQDAVPQAALLLKISAVWSEVAVQGPCCRFALLLSVSLCVCVCAFVFGHGLQATV